MTSNDTPKNAPKGVSPLEGPTLVRYPEASRFLWGDSESGEVADLVYGRNKSISSLVFLLRPGAFFRSSNRWKSYFDQHRFYFVLKGQLAVQDPETGDLAVARAGEALHWRGAKWHFGYNLTNDECAVLDWYAPQERPPSVTELEFGATKPQFQGGRAGREDLLGAWPDRLAATRQDVQGSGAVVRLTKDDALHFMQGERNPVLESIFASTKELTAGTVDLRAGARGDDRRHPSDKVIFVTSGKLHVYLPETFDWFELNAWDLLYLPPNTPHQYWNYSDRPVSFAFKVVPTY